jgi:hypothetical protein
MEKKTDRIVIWMSLVGVAVACVAVAAALTSFAREAVSRVKRKSNLGCTATAMTVYAQLSKSPFPPNASPAEEEERDNPNPQ